MGFALGGGLTYYTYGEQFGIILNETIGIGDNGTSKSITEISESIANTIIPESEPKEVVSKYRDCSIYDFDKLSMNELLKLTGDKQYNYHLEKAQSLTAKIKCNQYNQEIASIEAHKKWVEEQKEIARGF